MQRLEQHYAMAGHSHSTAQSTGLNQGAMRKFPLLNRSSSAVLPAASSRQQSTFKYEHEFLTSQWPPRLRRRAPTCDGLFRM
jgi:hypothetical protein